MSRTARISKQAVIVEGKYDKIKLSTVLDPEFSTTTKTAYGIYYGSTYPQTKMISFGLDMNF